MRNTVISISVLAVLFSAAGCAKNATEGPNSAGKRYLEAWMSVNHPGVQPSGLGIYVLPADDSGAADSDKTVTDNGYAFVEYTSSSLEGEISGYTSEETARQLGTYSESTYYGPVVWMTKEGTLQAGLREAVTGMKVGERKKVVIPSWLMSYSSYSTPEEYLAQNTDYTDAIYDLTVVDFTDDITEWQIDSIGRFFRNTEISLGNMTAAEVFNGMTAADSLTQEDGGGYGFYYKQISAPETDEKFPSDTTIYINYTGRLLDGKVFDTSIERVAKDNGIYSASASYGPVQINWGDSFGDITMGSSSSDVISGFALTLWQMKAMEKGVGVFYSTFGYGYSGSGTSIPGYAPLVFEIEIVAEP